MAKAINPVQSYHFLDTADPAVKEVELLNLGENAVKGKSELDDLQAAFELVLQGITDQCLSPDPESISKFSTRLLIVGTVGSGKSRLVNSLFDKEVAKDSSSVFEGTACVTEYKSEIKIHKNPRKITVMDTPGLQNPWKDNKQILKDIKAEYDSNSFVLLCFNVTQERVTNDDFKAIKNLTETLGVQIWRKAMFVLTFSNQLLPLHPQKMESSAKQFYKEKLQAWSSILQENLQYVGVSQDDAVQVPVVMAGLGQEPLPYLQLETHWLTYLWQKLDDRSGGKLS